MIYVVNPLSAFGWQYYDEAFREVKLARGAAGWDNYGKDPRPSSSPHDRPCVTTFGDSFTHGDEVGPDEAWSHLASERLGCGVANHGVGGYGTDQSLVRFNEVAPTTPVVLLGVYQEMLRRNLSASWLFYGMQRDATIKPFFTLASGKLQQVEMPASRSADAIKAYHSADRYYRPYHMQAPYSLSLLRAVYHRLSTPALNKQRMLPPESVYGDTEALALQSALMDRFRASLAQHGQHFALIFFPTADQAFAGDYPYESLLKSHAAHHPDDCLIDPGPALHEASVRAGRPLAAPAGHFDAIGNKVIAEVVSARLQACGIDLSRHVNDNASAE
ncbi:MAG: hypothetical protein WCP99_14340 [Burkholderiales bacterium]